MVFAMTKHASKHQNNKKGHRLDNYHFDKRIDVPLTYHITTNHDHTDLINGHIFSLKLPIREVKHIDPHICCQPIEALLNNR